MGSIKDIVDLITQLRNSVNDRKTVSELLQVQQYVDELHSECLQAKERSLDYKIEISEIKEKLIDAQREIRNLQDSYEEKIRGIKLIHHAEIAGADDGHEMHLEDIEKSHSKEIEALKRKIVELESQLLKS